MASPRNKRDRSAGDDAVLRPQAALPDGWLVYAVGDIHGRRDLLEALHRRIAADAAARPASRRVVVYLGDYVDRGPDSRGVIDLLLDRPLDGFERIHLLGNHEDFMLRFLAGDDALGGAWLMNGGSSTFASYGLDPLARVPGEDPMPALQRDLGRRVPARHLAFLRSLAPSWRAGSYFFAHAGVMPGVALDRQARDDLLWIRGTFLDSDDDHGAVVVHGHSISVRPERRANRIGIDTGAYASGRLTALALEPAEGGVMERFIQT